MSVNVPQLRFRNTLEALRECYSNLYDGGVSEEEEIARDKLIRVCHIIAGEISIFDEEEEDQNEEHSSNDLSEL